jgi:hypothetical protein
MNRRHFLQVLGGAAAAIALDPERALWVPGAKTIFLPPERRVEPATTITTGGVGFKKGDVFTIEGCYVRDPRTGQPTPHLQQFVVTADVDSAQSSMTVSQVCPRPIERGHYANVAGYERQRRPKATPLFVGQTLAEATARSEPDGRWSAELVVKPRDRGWSTKRV